MTSPFSFTPWQAKISFMPFPHGQVDVPIPFDVPCCYHLPLVSSFATTLRPSTAYLPTLPDPTHDPTTHPTYHHHCCHRTFQRRSYPGFIPPRRCHDAVSDAFCIGVLPGMLFCSSPCTAVHRCCPPLRSSPSSSRHTRISNFTACDSFTVTHTTTPPYRDYHRLFVAAHRTPLPPTPPPAVLHPGPV